MSNILTDYAKHLVDGGAKISNAKPDEAPSKCLVGFEDEDGKEIEHTQERERGMSR